MDFSIPEEYGNDALDYLAKTGETDKLEACLKGLINELLIANKMLSPFLPETSAKIGEIFTGTIEPPKTPLFPKN